MGKMTKTIGFYSRRSLGEALRFLGFCAKKVPMDGAERCPAFPTDKNLSSAIFFFCPAEFRISVEYQKMRFFCFEYEGYITSDCQ